MIDSGRYILGEEATRLSSEFIDYLGGDIGCVALNSGFDGIQLSLRALGVGRGDEVIVPSNAPIPVWMGVSITGATPVPAEPDRMTYNITSDGLDGKFSGKTKAVIPVYLYGRPIESIRDMVIKCRERGIYVLEDCSQAHGAELNGIKLGTFGDVGIFSFYPTKNMGAYGDAGLVVSKKKEILSKIALMRHYGDGNYIGVNSRMDSLQAAFLRVRLEWLDTFNQQRKHTAEIYLEGLRGILGLTLPLDHPGHVWHQFVIAFPFRDRLQAYLKSMGVETMIHYETPPNKTKFYINHPSQPIAESLSRMVLSLPIAPPISDDDAQYVVSMIGNAIRKYYE